MSQSFPTNLDSFTTKVIGNTLEPADVNDVQADVLAVETKIGIGASTPTANKVFRGNGTGTSVWAQVVLTTDVTGVLPTANGGTGAATLDGAAIPTYTSTVTLTNKRITKRVVTVSQSATPTINTDNTDVAYITGLAQAVTSFTTNLTGTPVNGDTLIIDITDDGTGRALTFGSSFEASGTIALPTTTVSSTKLTIGFRWNIATSKWTVVAVV